MSRELALPFLLNGLWMYRQTFFREAVFVPQSRELTVTPEEWNTSTDVAAMLQSLGDRATDRKLRLLACACCRRIWPEIVHEDSRRAIDTAESYADGEVSEEVLTEAFSASAWWLDTEFGPGQSETANVTWGVTGAAAPDLNGIKATL